MQSRIPTGAEIRLHLSDDSVVLERTDGRGGSETLARARPAPGELAAALAAAAAAADAPVVAVLPATAFSSLRVADTARARREGAAALAGALGARRDEVAIAASARDAAGEVALTAVRRATLSETGAFLAAHGFALAAVEPATDPATDQAGEDAPPRFALEEGPASSGTAPARR